MKHYAAWAVILLAIKGVALAQDEEETFQVQVQVVGMT